MPAMTPATEVVTESKPPKLPEARKLNGLVFVHPTFQSARSSVSISDKTCLSITPGVLVGPDGEFAPCEKGQVPLGFLVRRSQTQPKPFVQRDFIPWANVVTLSYILE